MLRSLNTVGVRCVKSSTVDQNLMSTPAALGRRHLKGLARNLVGKSMGNVQETFAMEDLVVDDEIYIYLPEGS